MSLHTEPNPQADATAPPPAGHARAPRRRRLGIAAAVAALAAAACGLGGTAAQATTTASVKHAGPAPANTDLTKPGIPSNGVYFGADPNFQSDKSPAVQAGILAGQIGRPLGIVSFYTGFASPPPTGEFATVAASGSVPMVSMHCGPPDSEVAAGKYDGILRSVASAYKAWGGPVFLRWFWEMNLPNVGHQTCLGPGTPASGQGTEYVDAYRRIWSIFQAEGATNVAFVWAPSDAYSAHNAEYFWPGPTYVDWIGADIYDRPPQSEFRPLFNTTTGSPCPTTTRPVDYRSGCFYQVWQVWKKPMIITETGAVGASAQSDWLGQIASDLQTYTPLVKGVVYVDATDLGSYVLAGPALAEFAKIGHEVYYSALGPQDGYLFTTVAGGVHSFGTGYYGSLAGKKLPAPIVGIAENRLAQGYWLVGADGSVYPFGKAKYWGSMRGKHLNKPIVGIAVTPTGLGYWLVATDGGIFSFGDAKYYGSMGGKHLNKPIVGMTSSFDGRGYWFVASDGGIFTFGDARYHGSTGGIHLNKPIVGMSSTRDALGYWLVASDGGVFSFGDAHYVGSLGGTRISSPVTALAPDPVSGGYRVITAAGVVWQFPGFVSFNPPKITTPAIGIATVSGG